MVTLLSFWWSAAFLWLDVVQKLAAAINGAGLDAQAQIQLKSWDAAIKSALLPSFDGKMGQPIEVAKLLGWTERHTPPQKLGPGGHDEGGVTNFSRREGRRGPPARGQRGLRAPGPRAQVPPPSRGMPHTERAREDTAVGKGLSHYMLMT